MQNWKINTPTKLAIELNIRGIFIHRYRHSHAYLRSSFKRIKHLCKYESSNKGWYLPKQFIQLPLKRVNNEIN